MVVALLVTIGKVRNICPSRRRHALIASGFEPAFAEWRRLTGFLDPARGVDPESGELTARRIDQGVQKFAKAMVPWELPGKRASDRLNSLRGILQKASDAGILLFVQPSTFVFDWTVADPNGDELVLVSPALVEEPSEASDITRPRTLVEARFARI